MAPSISSSRKGKLVFPHVSSQKKWSLLWFGVILVHVEKCSTFFEYHILCLSLNCPPDPTVHRAEHLIPNVWKTQYFFCHKLAQTAVFSKTRVISDYLSVSTPGMNFAKITKNFGWKPMEFSAECKEFDKNWENTTWQFRVFVNCKCTNFVNGIEKATIKSLSVRLSHVQNWLNVGSRKVGIAHF